MLKRFAQAIEDIEGQIINWSAPSSDVPSPVRFLVAVSGGVDSMCLADLCLRYLGPSRFALAHCNFHLRGDESDGDQELVASWSSANGVEFHKVDFDTETYAIKHGVSIEMAARDLRYAWFADLCRSHGFIGVMTAHNANDNAETLILNLLRGAGVHGMTGMGESSFLNLEGTQLRVFRPLLEMTRKQIEGYAFAWKIPYRDDSTNALSDYKRNRIRNEVFPQFGKINPSFVNTLNREAGYFSEAAEIIDDYCKARVRDVVSGNTISIHSLMQEKHWKYLLYYILSPYGFHSSTLGAIENLLESDRTSSGKRFESPTHDAFVERDMIHIMPKKSEADNDDCDPVMPVRSSGRYHFNGAVFDVEVLPWSSDMPLKQSDGIIIMDADKMSFPFVCRRWNSCDWFKPLGLKGKKKVSDLFTDLKYDSFAKDAAVMVVDCRADLADKQHVAGVLGVRIDDAYKVTSETERIIKIKLQK